MHKFFSEKNFSEWVQTARHTDNDDEGSRSRFLFGHCENFVTSDNTFFLVLIVHVKSHKCLVKCKSRIFSHINNPSNSVMYTTLLSSFREWAWFGNHYSAHDFRKIVEYNNPSKICYFLFVFHEKTSLLMQIKRVLLNGLRRKISKAYVKTTKRNLDLLVISAHHL